VRKKLLRFAVCILLAGCLVGCSAEYWANAYKPTTTVKVTKGVLGTSVSIKNTKDVTVDLGEVTWAKDGGLSVEHLKLIDASSPVLDAQTRQQEALAKTMQVQVDYQRQIGQNIALGIAAGGEALSAVLGSVPNFNAYLNTPYGSGGFSIEAVAKALQQAGYLPEPCKAEEPDEPPVE